MRELRLLVRYIGKFIHIFSFVNGKFICLSDALFLTLKRDNCGEIQRLWHETITSGIILVAGIE